MKTFVSSKIIKRNWYVIDAKGKMLGRLATELARRLRGKHKTEYTPYIDTGDYLIVLNANKIKISTTSNKRSDKVYYHYTGYVGGIKKTFFKDMVINHPNRAIEIAVKGMLPKGPLGRNMFRKLKVYAGEKHKHAAQKPQNLNI